MALLFVAVAAHERHDKVLFALALTVGCLNSASATVAWVLASRRRP
jgi:hypothetical protein